MELQLFNFENNLPVRTIVIDADVWFAGSDVASALGYVKPLNAITLHCKNKGTLKHSTLTNGGKQELLFINEANVYRLITRSKLKSCEKFEEWLFEEVVPSIRKTGGYNQDNQRFTPAFVQRYYENKDRVEKKYFSVIGEMYIKLYGEFDKVGYIIQDKAFDGKELRPDISVGKLFSAYLKKHHPEHVNNFKTYNHVFKNGLMIEARQYPNALLSIFYDFILDEWIPKHAHKYFSERDQKALEYLPKLIS